MKHLDLFSGIGGFALRRCPADVSDLISAFRELKAEGKI